MENRDYNEPNRDYASPEQDAANPYSRPVYETAEDYNKANHNLGKRFADHFLSLNGNAVDFLLGLD